LELLMAAPEQDRPPISQELDDNVEEAWAEEIEARLASVDKGQFSASPWREAIESIRQSLSQ
jgi:hypothetical protein